MTLLELVAALMLVAGSAVVFLGLRLADAFTPMDTDVEGSRPSDRDKTPPFRHAA